MYRSFFVEWKLLDLLRYSRKMQRFLALSSIGICSSYKLVSKCENNNDHKIHQPSFSARTSTTRVQRKGVPGVTLDSLVLITGSAHKELSQEISNLIKVPIADATLARFADGEVSLQINENIRGKDVVVIQPCAAPVNDSIMELLLTVSCARRAGARRIVAVIPYFGYKHHRRGSAISTKHHSRFLSSGAMDFAKMLQEMGVDRVIAVDLQRPGQGHEACFFDNGVPLETIVTTDMFVKYFINDGPPLQEPILVVTPNAECVKKARVFQRGLQKHFKSEVKVTTFFAEDTGSGAPDATKLDLMANAKVIVHWWSVCAPSLNCAPPAAERGRRRRHHRGRHGRHRGHTLFTLHAPQKRWSQKRLSMRIARAVHVSVHGAHR